MFSPTPATAPQWVTLPYPPPMNNLHAVVRGRKILTKQGRRYKEHAAAIARRAGIPLISEGPIVVSIRVFRPRRAGDLDNLFKAPFDALKGIAWVDDKQIEEIHAFRGDDKNNPRVEIRVSVPGGTAAGTGGAL